MGSPENHSPCQELLSQVGTWRSLTHEGLQELLNLIQERRRPAIKQQWDIGRFRWIFAVLFSIFAANLLQWMPLMLADGDNPQCIITMPVDSKNVFRPPVDCSICQDLHQVDIVYAITPDEFSSKYAYSGRPVVIKDALTNWTAIQVFSYDFFRRLYEEHSSGGSSRCQFFPYKTGFRSLGQALSMTKERQSEPFYFGWSNCDSEAADLLRRHYQRPYFLPQRSESSRTDWIFIGTAGLGAHMHVDHVGLPSWQAQISGRKLWSLEPSPECFYQCRAMDVVVEPGDTIVLDTNLWYHKTNVISEEVSITIGSEYD